MRRTKTICWSCRNARENKVDSIIIWWGKHPPGVQLPVFAKAVTGDLHPHPLLGGAGYHPLQVSFARWAHPRARVEKEKSKKSTVEEDSGIH